MRTKPATIEALARHYGWALDAKSSDFQLLASLDGAGAGQRKDGRISAKELQAAWQAPRATYGAPLSLGRLKELRALANGQTPIAKMPPALRFHALRADGENDGILSAADLSAYLANEPQRTLSLQRLSVLQSMVARVSGEADMLSVSGGRLLERDYWRTSYNDKARIPNVSAHVLSAEDLASREKVKRKDTFRADPGVPTEFAARPAWYEKTGYDMGHSVPYDDCCDALSGYQSFLLSNMTPQTPELNEQTWRVLEDGVRELVRYSGGKATIFTGNAFLDAELKPLAESQYQWIGPDKDKPDGKRRVAVPTHCYKAVMIELPNGKRSMFAFLVPNTKNVPTKKEDIRKFLDAAKLPVDQLEQLTGVDFFAGLPKPEAAKLEAKRDGLKEALEEITLAIQTQKMGGRLASSQKAAATSIENLKLMWPVGLAIANP